MERNDTTTTITNTSGPVPDTHISLVFVSGLPGIGKSTLFQNVMKRWIHEDGFNVVKAESDTYRQKAMKMEKLKPESRHLTPRELELKSKPVYTKLMHEDIRNIIAGLSKKDGKSIFILDKNYVPEKLREVIFSAAKDNFEKVTSFLILPSQSNLPELSIAVEEKENPFFLDTLCVSLIRCFSRKGHKSLCHGYSHSMKSIVGTLRSYAGEKFEDIAERWGMQTMSFNYFNVESLIEDSIKQDLRQKMTIVYQMIVKKNYDGDRSAELLFSNPELVKRICTYENHEQEYVRIAKRVSESS